MVELLSNADKLRLAIAMVEQPRLARLVGQAALVGLGPRRPRRHAELSAREGRVHLLVVLRSEPRHTLEPQEAAKGAWAQAAAQGGVEALRMEGACRAKDEARDAILDRLGLVLVLARLLEPVGVLLGLGDRK